MTKKTNEQPDNTMSLNIFTTAFDEALRPWIEKYGRDAYLQDISSPITHSLPGYLTKIDDIARVEHFAEILGEPLLADQAARELKQLKRRLNGENRDVLEEILGAMDRMAEVVEDLGASAPDKKTYDDYMYSRRRLEIARTLIEPHMRERLSAPDRRLSDTDFKNAVDEAWETIRKKADDDASGTTLTAMKVFSRIEAVSKRLSSEADADKPETHDAFNELQRVLQSLDRNVLEGICDIMDNISDAVADVGSYATDDESENAHRAYRVWLEKIDALLQPLRAKLKSMPKQPPEQPPEQPPIEQPEQPPAGQPEQPPAGQPPVEQPPVEQPPVEQPEQPEQPLEQPHEYNPEWVAITPALFEALGIWEDGMQQYSEYSRKELKMPTTAPEYLADIVLSAYHYIFSEQGYKKLYGDHLRQLKRQINGESRELLEDLRKGLDRVADCVEGAGASATDEKSKAIYESSKEILGIVEEHFGERIRTRLSSPDAKWSSEYVDNAIHEAMRPWRTKAMDGAGKEQALARKVVNYVNDILNFSKDNELPEIIDTFQNRMIYEDRDIIKNVIDVLKNIKEHILDASSYAVDDESKRAARTYEELASDLSNLADGLHMYFRLGPFDKPYIPPPPDMKMLRTTFDNAKEEVLLPWKDTDGKKVLHYVDGLWENAVNARNYKSKNPSKAEQAQRTYDELVSELNDETDVHIIMDVHMVMSRIDEATEELIANATDETSRKYYTSRANLLKSIEEKVVNPVYDKFFHKESSEERMNRLDEVVLKMGVPQQVMTDAFYDLDDFEQDMLYDVIDALSDVYSASIGYGSNQSSDRVQNRMHFDEMKQLEQGGLFKAGYALHKCYSEIGEDSAKRLLNVVGRIQKSLSNSTDATVRTIVAKSLGKVLGQMTVRYRQDKAENDYNEYLIPEVPGDWGPDSDEKQKNLENLNEDIMYILSRDGTNKGIGKYFPPNVDDPLRFLVEHYMPSSKDSAAFENWRRTDPILRELAKQLPWGGVDTKHTVNMLVPLLQDAQRYFTDTRPATPYGVFMSKLAGESERTQRMMARNDFRFERYEYIKRLRQAYGIKSEKQRTQILNGILDDMSGDISSIRNLGASANDPLPRNLKGDMDFFRNGANSFKKDLEQLRDAVMDNMNGGTAEPPGWTGFRNWEELLDPRNPLNGREVDGANAMKEWEEDEALHTKRKRKYIPQFEARDMWNDPEGDPRRIMRELRNRNIIPGAHPEYSTRPVIRPEDFKELNAMVGPSISRDTRGMNPEEREALVHAFSQKALYIASNLAFGPNDGAALEQFQAAMELASRCREGRTAGASRNGLSFNTQYGMYRRALGNRL